MTDTNTESHREVRRKVVELVAQRGVDVYASAGRCKAFLTDI